MSISLMRSRLRTILLDSIVVSSDSAVLTRINNTNPNGSYVGVNYTTDPQDHTTAMRILARAYNAPGTTYYRSTTVKDKLVLLATYWDTTAIDSTDNWYYKWIACNVDLGHSLILMDTEDAFGFTRLELSDWSDKVYDLDFSLVGVGSAQVEGSNLMYLVYCSIMRGILKDTSVNFNDDLNTAEGDINRKNSFNDGLVTDYSYRFHESIPHWTGGYGMGQLELSGTVLYLVYETEWERLTAFNEYYDAYIHGLLWHQHKRVTDIAHMGRQYGDPSSTSYNKLDVGSWTISLWLSYLSVVSFRSADRAFIVSIANGTANMPAGIKYHYLSQALTRKTATSHIGIIFPTKRLSRFSESFSGSGITHVWLRVGSYMMLTEGEELYQIQPVLVWSRIPGVTSLDYMPTFEGELIANSIFGGAANNNEFGVVGYKHDWKQVTGNKFYFVTPEGMFCMGNGITSTNGTHQMITTLQQNISLTPATIKRSVESTLDGSSTTQSDIQWVFNGNAGYVFPAGGNVTVTNQNQSGSWSLVNSNQSSATITRKIFSARINHGINTANQTYQYIVVQDTTLFAMQNYVNPYTVIKNDSVAQVVRYSTNIYGIVFYQKGSVNLESGVTLSVKDACVMLIVFPLGDRLSANIYVTDPIGTLQFFEFDISLNLSNEFSTSNLYNSRFKVPTPKQDFANSCITLICT
jgi:chondroitin AC lyase